MTSIFKKSLACCLAVVLCLTCMLGALTVSAAEVKEGTFTVENATVTPGTATADVEITIDAEAANVIIMQVETEAGEVTAVEAADAEGAAMQAVLDAKSKKIYVSNGDGNIAPFDSVVVTVTVALADIETEKEYDVVAKLISAASNVEDEFVIADATGKIIVKAAEPEVPECKHDWVAVDAVAAEGTDEWDDAAGEYVQIKAGSITFKCSECEETKTETVKWSWDYYVPFTAASCAAEISLQFSCDKSELVINGDYSDVYMLINHVLSSDGSTKSTLITESIDADVPFGGEVYACKTFSYGLKSTQLSESVDSIPFVCVDGVWYSGDITSYSMRDYVDERLPMGDCADTEKAVLVNMLTYGSKMQQLKNYNMEKLADADLGVYAQFVITTDPVIEGDVQWHPDEAGVYIPEYVLDMADRITTNFYMDSYYYESDNVDDYIVKVTWENANGVAKEQIFDSSMYESIPDDDGNFNWYFMFAFAGLDSYDLRQDITVVIYDAITGEDISGEFVASVEKLISNGITSGTYSADEIVMFKAVMNYSDAARAHFCK